MAIVATPALREGRLIRLPDLTPYAEAFDLMHAGASIRTVVEF